MTKTQREALVFLLPKINAAIPETEAEGRAAFTLLSGLLLDSHGAADHAPKTRGRRRKAAGEMDTASPP